PGCDQQLRTNERRTILEPFRTLGTTLMRMPLTGFTLIFAVALGPGPCAQAQPYCAMYSDGERNCGIPSWQSCQQSISGVGGFCAPDTTAAPAPMPIDGP